MPFFTRRAGFTLQLPSSSFFLVCSDVVVVSVMPEVYARRRGGARSAVVAVELILVLK